MFKTLLAVALSLSLATVAYAKEAAFSACTQDGKAVVLAVDINDGVSATHPVEAHIALAFSTAAATLTADQLLSEVGFYTFKSGLDDTDISAIDGLAAPTVTGTCKQ